MEKFKGNEKEKPKKKLSKKLRGALFLGSMTAATSVSGETVSRNLNQKTPEDPNLTSQNLETENQALESGVAYDKESNTFSVKNESEEMGFDYAFSQNMPNRFFEFDKYKNFSQDAKTVAAVICEAYNELSLSNNQELVPSEIFDNETYMALQITESGYDTDAKSWVGAVGVMQNMKDSIIDMNKTIDLLRKEGFDLGETGEISKELASEIQEMIKIDSNLGRSVGKLYLNSLHFRYKIEDRDTILAAYNFGPRAKTTDPEKWPKETKDYVEKNNIYRKNLEILSRDYPGLSNREKVEIVKQFGHDNGEIAPEFIAKKLGVDGQLASR